MTRVVTLSDEQHQKFLEVLENVDDEGPAYAGWKSDALCELIILVQDASAGMTEERAREILKDFGGPERIPVSRDYGHLQIVLESGGYSAAELEAIVWWAKNKA